MPSRRHPRSPLLAVLLAAGLTGHAVIALGQPSADAVARASGLQAEGVQLFGSGDYAAALTRFREAYALVPSPKVLFNLGRTHAALGDEVHALRAFDGFLDEAMAVPADKRAEAARLAEQLRAKLGYVALECADVGATVSIDDEEIGATPLPRPLAVRPGARALRVARAGFRPFEARPAPLAGQKVRVVAVLVPLGAEPRPAAKTATATATVTVPAEPAAAVRAVPGPVAAQPPPVTPQRWSRTAAWIAAGSSLALVGAGLTAQLLAASKYHAFNEVVRFDGQPRCGRDDSGVGGGPCPALLESADSRRRFAIAGYVAGAATAALAATFYGLSRSNSSPRLACAASAQPGGASCSLTF